MVKFKKLTNFLFFFIFKNQFRTVKNKTLNTKTYIILNMKKSFLSDLPIRDLINLLHNTPFQTKQSDDIMNEIEDRNLSQYVIKGLKTK